jgi:hypothetical protein
MCRNKRIWVKVGKKSHYRDLQKESKKEEHVGKNMEKKISQSYI